MAAASFLTLRTLPQRFAIVRLAGSEGLPWWAAASDGLLAFVRSVDEVSLVCEARLVPGEVRAERGYRALRVEGTLPLQATGVLSSLSGPLAQAGVPIFVISTFDTDYVLVPEMRCDDAVRALRGVGHQVNDDQSTPV